MRVFETVHDILYSHGQKSPSKVSVTVNNEDHTNGDMLKNVASLVEFLKKREVSS